MTRWTDCPDGSDIQQWPGLSCLSAIVSRLDAGIAAAGRLLWRSMIEGLIAYASAQFVPELYTNIRHDDRMDIVYQPLDDALISACDAIEVDTNFDSLQALIDSIRTGVDTRGVQPR